MPVSEAWRTRTKPLLSRRLATDCASSLAFRLSALTGRGAPQILPCLPLWRAAPALGQQVVAGKARLNRDNITNDAKLFNTFE